MTNSTKLIGLFMTAAMWAGVAVAQGPGSNWGDDTPPDLTLPTPSALGVGPSNVMLSPGGEESLNVAAAAAICLYESSRRSSL